MEYYIRKIQRCGQYRVAHLTSFLYDTDRIRHIVDHMPLVSPTLHDRLSENVLVWQCLSLAQVHDIVNELLLSFSGSSASEGSFNLVVIEDLDEAFNIASFENYILGMCGPTRREQEIPNMSTNTTSHPAAGKTIVSIMRTIRKLSQTYDVTFMVSRNTAPHCRTLPLLFPTPTDTNIPPQLAQRKARMNFNVKHVARMVRSMLDTQVVINGPRVLVDCVYDNV